MTDMCEVVMKLNGEIEPVGESNEDKRRLQNLKYLTLLVDSLISEVMRVSTPTSNIEASIVAIKKYAQNYLIELEKGLMAHTKENCMDRI